MKFPVIHTRAFETWAPVVARLVFGAQFLFAAFGKIPGVPSFSYAVGFTASHGVPFAGTAVVLAFLLELVAGAMLLLGWKTRVAAVVLVPYVLLLAVVFYRDLSNPMNLGAVISHVSLAAALLLVSAYGAKRFAVKAD